RGQTDAQVRFVARGVGATTWLTDDATVFAFAGEGATDVLRLRFVGASRSSARGVGELPTRSHYFRGGEALRAVPHFAGVQNVGLYDGVDLRRHGDAGRFEYDLTLHPGADVG